MHINACYCVCTGDHFMCMGCSTNAWVINVFECMIIVCVQVNILCERVCIWNVYEWLIFVCMCDKCICLVDYSACMGVYYICMVDKCIWIVDFCVHGWLLYMPGWLFCVHGWKCTCMGDKWICVVDCCICLFDYSVFMGVITYAWVLMYMHG
jgi:hypothetical protein